MSPLSLFWLPGSIAFLGVLVSVISMEKYGDKCLRNFCDASGKLRVGGWFVMGVSIIGMILHPNLVLTVPFWGFLFMSLVVLAVGLVDDLRGLSWRWQIFWQWVVVSGLFVFGVRILTLTNPWGPVVHIEYLSGWIGYGIFLVWGIFLLNALNWFDGVDGIAGMTSAFAYTTLIMLSLTPVVNQPPLAVAMSILLGATCGFLCFNTAGKKIIAGTVGVWFWGLSLVFFSTVSGAKIATAVVVLALPLADACFVLGERLLAGQSLTTRDRRHLHYRLLDCGYSSVQVQLLFGLMTGALALSALWLPALGKVWAAGIALVFVFCTRLVARNSDRSLWNVWSILGMVLASLGMLLWFWQAPVLDKNIQSVDIEGTRYSLEVAQSDEEKERGLAGRGTLCPSCGMVFLFDSGERPTFWMQGMQFGLDFAWIRDGVIVHKTENVAAESDELLEAPGEGIDEVIELSAGSLQGVAVGTRIQYFRQ